jgi:formate hydrogenlyase subunit 6/NADH:ubiquinone oxidoreductase subunit I
MQFLRMIFMVDFLSGFWLAMKYLFRPKMTLNYLFG